MTVLGLIFLGVGVIMVVAASGGLPNRMPTQVPPRAVAAVPLLFGIALIVCGPLVLIAPVTRSSNTSISRALRQK